MSERIERIRKAVEEMEGCDARHVMSSPILELCDSHPVWDGVVEVFELKDHTSRTVLAYASLRMGSEKR